MPKGGRPKPTELKIVQGTLNKSRERARGIEQAPEFEEVQNIDPPETLDGLALSTWQDLAPKLQRAKVLREADLRALESYCIAYANMRRAQESLEMYGVMLMNENTGAYYKNPAATAVNESLTQLARYSAMLGLDPSSRTRINVGKKDADKGNPFAALQRKPSSRKKGD